MGSGTGVSDCLARTALIIVNFIFFLSGGAVLACGIIALTSPDTITKLFQLIPGYEYLQYYIDVTQAVFNNAILLTCIGGVIVVLSIIGCIGSFGFSCFTILYAVLVLLLVLFELAVIMWASIEKQQIDNRIADLMFTSLKANFYPIQEVSNYGIAYSNVTSGAAWEYLQFRYSCCGARGPSDYQQFTWNTSISVNGVVVNATVPPSCCLQTTLDLLPVSASTFVNLNNCLTLPAYSQQARYLTGCYVAVVDELSQYTYVTVLIFSSLIAIEIIVIMIALAARKPSKVSAV